MIKRSSQNLSLTDKLKDKSVGNVVRDCYVWNSQAADKQIHIQTKTDNKSHLYQLQVNTQAKSIS